MNSEVTDGLLADLAGRAYQVQPEGMVADWSFGDVRAVLFRVGDINIVAFRGTVPSDAADWFRDLDAWPTWRRRLGFCHRGFITGAEMALGCVRKVILLGGRLIMTGHSLGGALAIGEAALMIRQGWEIEAVVTFGAPRVGFWKMRRLLSKTTIRQYVDADDPVPQVPRPYLHMRQPIVVGRPLLNPLDAHAIARYGALVPATVLA